MHYTIKHHIIKLLVLLGMLLCITNYGYTLYDLFSYKSDIVVFVDVDQNEVPENDTEDRSDKLEDEIEKDMISFVEEYSVFDSLLTEESAKQSILLTFSDIHLELKTPPPELS